MSYPSLFSRKVESKDSLDTAKSKPKEIPDKSKEIPDKSKKISDKQEDEEDKDDSD